MGGCSPSKKLGETVSYMVWPVYMDRDGVSAFIAMAGDYWLMIGGITLFDVALFNAPIIVRLKSIDE